MSKKNDINDMYEAEKADEAKKALRSKKKALRNSGKNSDINDMYEAEKAAEVKKAPRLRGRALKQGGFVIAMTAIVLVVIIVINVIATTLYNKYPLSFDLTADQHFTITDENQEYIRNINKPVTIYALSPETDYATNLQTMLSYQGYYGSVDLYAQQTYEFLLSYAKINNNIQIVFIDPDQPEMQDISQKYSDVSQSMNYCDLLVTSEFELNGQTISRHKLISSTDFFETETDSYGYYTTISGSNLESVLTSALYTVTSERTYYVGNIASHNTSAIDNYSTLLENNNYVVEEISSLVTADIDSKYDIVVLCAPTEDFSEEEVNRLSAFLENGGNYGKSLIYIASSNQGELPNLEEFLYEWGYTFKSGTLYETDSGYHRTGRNTEVLSMAESNDILEVPSSYYFYVSDYNKPILIESPNNSAYSVKSLVGFNDTTVIYPANAPEDWTADNAEKGDFVRAGMSTYTTYSGIDPITSNVVALSSADFINNSTVSSSYVYNLNLMLSLSNHLVGAADEITFTNKVIESDTFSPTEANVNVVRWIFAIIVPILVIAAGIYIFVRRKNL